METDVLLRTILFQSKTAKSQEDAIIAIEAMGPKDMIAAVNEKVSELNARR